MLTELLLHLVYTFWNHFVFILSTTILIDLVFFLNLHIWARFQVNLAIMDFFRFSLQVWYAILSYSRELTKSVC